MRDIYGYVRVSSTDQNEIRQVMALQATGVRTTNIYMDKVSGQDFKRPQYLKLVNRLHAGDLLFIMSIDRLGRNYREILEQWRILTKEIGADVCVIDMPQLDTRNGKDLMGTFIADLVLQILSFVAENERDNIKKRQAGGIAAAKARGVRFGRPTTDMPDNFPQIVKNWDIGIITTKQAIQYSNMSRSTFYRKVRDYELKNRKCIKRV